MTSNPFATPRSPPFPRAAAALALAFAFPALANDTFTGVSLRVLNEDAPPGGAVQMKVTVTEPTPIIIGGGLNSFGPALGAVMGVLLPSSPDAGGAAVIQGHNVMVRAQSPSGNLGLSTGVPAIVVTIAVPATTPLGATAPLTLDPAWSFWLDPSGQPYAQEIRQGSFLAAGTVSINDVLPGGGFLRAGSVITVVGLGFQPGASVEIDGIAVASTTWVSPNRLDVATGADGQLDGKRVRVRNPDLSRASYFSYLRATSLGTTARPLLAATEPIYPVQPQTTGFVATPAPAAGKFVGLALQNPSAAPATVSVALIGAGSVVASTSLTLPSRTEVVREASELLSGVIPQAGTTLRVTADVPVQILGLAGDDNDGSVAPLLPTLTAP